VTFVGHPTPAFQKWFLIFHLLKEKQQYTREERNNNKQIYSF